MNKLALSDDILMKVEKPARYIGGEVNAVVKNKEEVDMRICFLLPGCVRNRHVPSGYPDSVRYVQPV